MRRGWRAAALIGFGLMLSGCLELGGSWAITSSTTSTATNTSTSTTSAATTAASAALTGDTDATGCSFFQCGDLMAADCNYWAQDCPEGDKCVPFPENGQTWTGEHRCSPIDPHPDAIGEPCTYEVTEWLWIDSCGADAVCYAFASDELGAGVCWPLCTGDTGNLKCADGYICVGFRESVNPVCLPMCDPIAQDCPEGDACRAALGGYVCRLDTSGAEGDYLDWCASSWHCSPGYECVPDVWLPECEHGDCCARLCDVNVEGACPKGLDCIPYYEPGENPAYEHVGLCAVES